MYLKYLSNWYLKLDLVFELTTEVDSLLHLLTTLKNDLRPRILHLCHVIHISLFLRIDFSDSVLNSNALCQITPASSRVENGHNITPLIVFL